MGFGKSLLNDARKINLKNCFTSGGKISFKLLIGLSINSSFSYPNNFLVVELASITMPSKLTSKMALGEFSNKFLYRFSADFLSEISLEISKVLSAPSLFVNVCPLHSNHIQFPSLCLILCSIIDIPDRKSVVRDSIALSLSFGCIKSKQDLPITSLLVYPNSFFRLLSLIYSNLKWRPIMEIKSLMFSIINLYFSSEVFNNCSMISRSRALPII